MADELIYHTCTDQRCEQSEIEKTIVERIAALGVPIVPQVKRASNWVFDGAINGTRLLVEIHGNYWHERPEVQERDARDARKQEWATQNGYRIITIWESEWEESADAVLVRVAAAYMAARREPIAGADQGDKGDTRRPPRSTYGDWRDPFLEALAETGIVLDAIVAANISRKTAYKHRGEDADFAEQWKLALADASDLLKREARRRGLAQSDAMLKWQIQQLDPEWRDVTRVEHTGKDGGPIEHEQLTNAERTRRAAALFNAARARRAGQAPDAGSE